MRYSVLITALLAGALVAGCSEDSSSPLAPGLATLLRVSPSDGTSGVPLDAAVTLTFSAPVNRDMVQRDLHLISEWAISDSMCPDSATMHHPDMDHCMADLEVMHHLDRHHSTPGGFSWNEAGTECSFHPSTRMASETQYMIHIGPEMTRMVHGDAMHGTMGGHGADRETMFRFMTSR